MIKSIFLIAEARRTERGEEPDLPFSFPDRPVKIGQLSAGAHCVWHAVADDKMPLFLQAVSHAAFRGHRYDDLRGQAFERELFEAEWEET